MSRLAKQPITIPNSVEVRIEGNTVHVKGPKGELAREFKTDIIGIEITDGTIVLTPKGQDTFSQALWGTYAAHLVNMMQGVTEEYSKKLIVEGVGYKWAVNGEKLDLSLGFSHPVVMEIPKGLTVTAEKNELTISGINKEEVGQFAAKVRAKKKPEPYKGKGIRYADETIIRKQGKKTV